MVIEIPGVEQRHITPVSGSNLAFIQAALGEPRRVHYLSRTNLVELDSASFAGPTGRRADVALNYPVATVSQLIQGTHQAFAHHANLMLSPEIIWYAICHEVAILIKSNPQKYARYFTDSPETKQEILVRDDSLVYGANNNDWLRSINLVREPLREKLPAEALDLFLPQFSTLTPESETAILVAFMDTISSYYEFRWQTDCGIPKVRLEGNIADWELLVRSVVTLSEIFLELSGYFVDLLSVLREIVRTVKTEGHNQEFWHSIYKYGGGSGGPYVSGWITAFFAYLSTSNGPRLKQKFDWYGASNGWGGYNTNEFPAHLSQVRFVWDYFGKQIPMAFITGILGREYNEGFVVPKLGVGIVELVA